MTHIELLMALRPIIHYGFHLVFPALIAYWFFRPFWKKAWLIMIATMLVDLDHLLANPIFDPNRCSIGFHILHSEMAIMGYVLMLFSPKTRVIGAGLVWHMMTDYQDCLWMHYLETNKF